MALAARVDARGFVRCPACGVRFKERHTCRASLGEFMPHRPEGFEALVEEFAAEHRAEQAAAEQLSFDDAAAACTRCGGTSRHVDVESGLCTGCMAADARAQAARIAEFHRSAGLSRPPP